MPGTVGSLVAVLDALLTTGYNTKTINTLTQTGGTATAYVPTGHGLNTGDAYSISGANESGFNVAALVTVTDSTHFTYPVDPATASTATGPITGIVPPAAGWAKVYSGTNRGVYRASSGSRLYLDVDDTYGKVAKVTMYETMTAVGTGTGASTTLFWSKSNAADATTRPWEFVCDSQMFYILLNHNIASYPGLYNCYHFGDMIPLKSDDAYHCTLLGDATDQSAAAPMSSANFCAGGIATGFYIARSYSQGGGNVGGYRTLPYVTASVIGIDNVFTYPIAANGGGIAFSFPVWICEGSNSLVARGFMPGIMCPLHVRPMSHGDTVPNPLGMSGKTIRMVKMAYSSGSEARVGFDITGPWR